MSDTPRLQFVSLENCSTASGVVVAVDVCRAFTTAAYAFAAGVKQIFLVATVEEALALRVKFPGTLVMGEVGGEPVPEFDLWNSPSQFNGLDVVGKTLIQRTTAGTQGIVRSVKAEHLLAASFAVARATVQAIRRWAPQEVTFVLTGLRSDREMHGLEDVACAEYMAALLRGEDVQAEDYLAWTQDLSEDSLEGAPVEVRRQYNADIALCALADNFDFALSVQRRDGLLIMEMDQ